MKVGDEMPAVVPDQKFGNLVGGETTLRKWQYDRDCSRFNIERRKRIEKCWDCSLINQCNPAHCYREKKGKDNGV